jgi:hypothetical protein
MEEMLHLRLFCLWSEKHICKHYNETNVKLNERVNNQVKIWFEEKSESKGCNRESVHLLKELLLLFFKHHVNKKQKTKKNSYKTNSSKTFFRETQPGIEN